jgi:hypothetical protein
MLVQTFYVKAQTLIYALPERMKTDKISGAGRILAWAFQEGALLNAKESGSR